MSGCRQAKACEALDISERRLQRWAISEGQEDQRSGPKRAPVNKLTGKEKAYLVSLATSREYCDLSPHQIVPKLADQGIYVASESSFYRVLKENSLLTHRGSSKPRTVSKPRSHEAFAPGKLFRWDITYLQSRVKGKFFYLYLFLDVFSRKIVGWDIYDTESEEYASALLNRICINESIEKNQIARGWGYDAESL